MGLKTSFVVCHRHYRKRRKAVLGVSDKGQNCKILGFSGFFKICENYDEAPLYLPFGSTYLYIQKITKKSPQGRHHYFFSLFIG